MTSELLVKRLLNQAGVSVLAGLLMSSAVWAEDASVGAGEPEVSFAVADTDAEIGIDPAEGETVGAEEGVANEEGVVNDGEVAEVDVSLEFSEGETVGAEEGVANEEGVLNDGETPSVDGPVDPIDRETVDVMAEGAPEEGVVNDAGITNDEISQSGAGVGSGFGEVSHERSEGVGAELRGLHRVVER